MRNNISGLFKTANNIIYVLTILSVWQQAAFFYNKPYITLSTNIAQNFTFYFLTTLKALELSQLSKNCKEKTQPSHTLILEPPDNLLFGSKRDGSGWCFLYFGPLSWPLMSATGLQALKQPFFWQYQPTPSWSEACKSIRVAVQRLD